MEGKADMNLDHLDAYRLIEARRIEDISSMSYLLEHIKSGARIALLENEDKNKVFYIAFRTPPADSTGVAHIIEHSVLEGSRDFPVKDPFIELAKGSLNTFLNAMTYPDKTVYPIASCNDADFKNLMHVYLDAVFYPNIYREKKIFEQEGWHYELKSLEDPLTINGVVYNEMKGAYSSPDDVLSREITRTLYPDTPYGLESGGDPEEIPKLSYEQFLDFHRKYYHPSNSYIYLYGNMDMEERLLYLDRAYLSHFDRISVDSSIVLQPPFAQPSHVRSTYPVSDAEPLQDNTYLSYNIVLGENLDREAYIAYDLIDYALCGAPGAPLKQALLDAGIGKDVYSSYECGMRQMFYSVVAKNANEEQSGEFIRIIEDTLKQVADEGVEENALLAALNSSEFKYREADFGSYPPGLMYGLQMLDSWLYEDTAPFIHIEAGDTFRRLREKVGSGYYEGLIREHMLDNTHKSILTVVPGRGLLKEQEDALSSRLAAYKASLSGQELKSILEETEALRRYQETPDSEEALATIPLLKREDIDTRAEPFINEELECDGTKVLFHEQNTRQIGYFRFVFDAGALPDELFPYLAILKLLLGLVDAGPYSYYELFNEINMHTGGIAPVTNVFADTHDPSRVKVTFEMKGRAMEDSLPRAVALTDTILFSSRFEDDKRLKEILAEAKSHMQAVMISSGHSLAKGRVASYLSLEGAYREELSGMTLYRLIERLEDNFDQVKEDLKQKLYRLLEALLRPENLMLDYIGSREGLNCFLASAKEVKERLHTGPCETGHYLPAVEKKNEGYLSASQVQFVACAGNYRDKGLSYTGSLRVLKVIMGYEYLWKNLREQGGAYGCMASFGTEGIGGFVSYRDPHLRRTLEVYQRAAEYVESFDADERTMTKFVIGAISDIDVPMTPQTAGLRSMTAYQIGLSYEEVQRERDELLATDAASIRALAGHIRAIMSDDCICVVGNENKLRENQELFMKLENLYG